MSEALTAARPYARAVFALAQSTHAEQPWSRALMQSAKIASNPKIARLLANSALSKDQQLKLFAYDSLPHFNQFIHELMSAGRLPILSEISQIYHQLWAEAEGVIHATVTVAQPVPQAHQQRLVRALEKRFQRRVELTTHIDASLLGGAVIEANGVVIDGSAQGKLARLRDQFAFSSF